MGHDRLTYNVKKLKHNQPITSIANNATSQSQFNQKTHEAFAKGGKTRNWSQARENMC